MEALDLDVNNYSIYDIERFFRYKPNDKFDASQIELREAEIRNQLLGSGHVDPKMKRDLMSFMQEAKSRLIQAKCPPPKAASTIPKNHTLDELQYPVSRRSEEGREGDLIAKPETPFVYTQDCEYFPGVMNPLKTRIITRYLNVDTRFRKSSPLNSSTDFTFQLPMKLNKVVSMQLATFEMQYSFYRFSSFLGNNYIQLGVIYLNSGYYDTEPMEMYKTIVIPDGNYSITELISVLNALISPRNPDSSLIDPTDYFSYIEFAYDAMSGKVSLKKNAMPSEYGTLLEVILDQRKNINGEIVYGGGLTKTLGWQLGFTQEFYKFSTQVYVGERVADAYNIKYLYFVVEDFHNSSNNYFINAFDESIMSPHILARISFQKTGFHLLTENDLNIITEPRKYFGPVDITKLKIRLMDDKGHILDMNGGDYSFCLIFKMMYE